MVFAPVYDEETQELLRFDMKDQYRVRTGLPTEGRSPYDQYCAHWFTTRPDFDDGGVVAMGWYEHGTRFLDVAEDTGEITELGYFLPVGGSTSAAYWLNDEIVYSVDYQRGIDILRFTGAPATSEEELPSPPGFNPVPASSPTRVLTDGPRSRGQYVCPLPI